MDLRTAIEAALDGQAVLFTGSGFSFGATNVDGEPLPMGNGLRDRLAKECGYAGSDYTLEFVAQDYVLQLGKPRLVALLKRLYAVKAFAAHHETVMSVPWKRVYTTNYDAVAEMAAVAGGSPLSPAIFADDYKDTPKDGLCLHVNGSIDRLDVNSLDDGFRLTDTSYSSGPLSLKKWLEYMFMDFKVASAIVVVGHSMQYDLDLKRLLSATELKDHILFVTGPSLDAPSLRVLGQYGACEAIGVEGLAREVEAARKAYVHRVTADTWRAFTHESQCPKTLGDASYQTLYNFYYRGDGADAVYAANTATNEAKYLTQAEGLGDFLKGWDAGKRVFVVTSALGNGKSVFCRMVREELRQKRDLDVFTLRGRTQSEDMAREVERICAMADGGDEVAVIIDNFYSYYDVLDLFSHYGCGHVRFVLSARTSIGRINASRLMETLGADIKTEVKPINLNRLKDDDIWRIIDIFRREGFLGEGAADGGALFDRFKFGCGATLSGILLDRLRSERILEGYRELFEADESQDIKDVAIMALACPVFNAGVDLTDVIHLLGLDWVCYQRDASPLFVNLFKDDGSFAVTSPILARVILHEVVDFSSLTETLVKVIRAADAAKEVNPSYGELLKALVSHSVFEAFPGVRRTPGEVTAFYDSIRNVDFCRGNAFFWEQFALALIDSGDFDAAKTCVRNAYGEAKRQNLVPFQVANVEAKGLVEELNAENGAADPTTIGQCLTDIHALLVRHYDAKGNNVEYAFSIAFRMAQVARPYLEAIDAKARATLLGESLDMQRRLDEYLGKGTFVSIPQEALEAWKAFLEKLKTLVNPPKAPALGGGKARKRKYRR